MYILDQVTDCCMENRLAGRNTRSLFCKSIIHIARGRANVRRQKNKWILEVKDLRKRSRQDWMGRYRPMRDSLTKAGNGQDLLWEIQGGSKYFNPGRAGKVL